MSLFQPNRLNTPDDASFYVGGDAGYIDYPFLNAAS